jgi:hypothetical protein
MELVYGEVAPATTVYGPVTFDADSRVPADQLTMVLFPDNWAVKCVVLMK